MVILTTELEIQGEASVSKVLVCKCVDESYPLISIFKNPYIGSVREPVFKNKIEGLDRWLSG